LNRVLLDIIVIGDSTNVAHSNRSIRIHVVRASIPRVLVHTPVSGGDVSGDDDAFGVGDTVHPMGGSSGLKPLFFLFSHFSH